MRKPKSIEATPRRCCSNEATPKRMPGPRAYRLYPRTTEVNRFARSMRNQAQSAERSIGCISPAAFNPPPAFANGSAVPPFVVVVSDGSHSVPPQFDFDWTLHKVKKLELQRREQRDQLVKEALQSGKTVKFRSSGNSLDPWVLSNDSCTYAPVTDPKELRLHDVVFCQVQPCNRFYGHIIKQIVEHRGRPRFHISNLRGRVNGTCEMEHIYGKLIHVER